MKKVDTPVSEYFETLPEEVRDDMLLIHKEVSKAMKGLPVILWKGRMWGGSDQTIIGYGDMQYPRAGGKSVEWFYVGLALQKNYISLYVNAVADNKYLAQAYGSELGKVKIGSASISFRRLSDVNLPRLRELLAQARKLMP